VRHLPQYCAIKQHLEPRRPGICDSPTPGQLTHSRPALHTWPPGQNPAQFVQSSTVSRGLEAGSPAPVAPPPPARRIAFCRVVSRAISRVPASTTAGTRREYKARPGRGNWHEVCITVTPNNTDQPASRIDGQDLIEWSHPVKTKRPTRELETERSTPTPHRAGSPLKPLTAG